MSPIKPSQMPAMAHGHILDPTVYRSANALVCEHGAEAPIFAAMEADSMLESGDLDGYVAWRRVMVAVQELCQTMRQDGGVLH